MGGLGSTGGVWEWQGDEPEQKQTPALRNDNEKGKSNRDDKSHRGPVIYMLRGLVELKPGGVC